VWLPLLQLPLVSLLLIDDVRDGEEEIFDLHPEALVTFAILLNRLQEREDDERADQG
jgi:hypothetical protein